MKVLFLNLPHKDKIVRRYMCSYNSPVFLFPPYELLQAAACVKVWNNSQVFFLDSVAENKDEEYVMRKIAEIDPDVVVANTGIESIETDLKCVERLKSKVKAKFAIFGYYPTLFSKEILESYIIDVILRNEPEKGLSGYIKCLEQGTDMTGVAGIAFKGKDGHIVVNAEKRIEHLDELPFPDYSLIDIKKYSEMLLGGPLGVIQSSRGCPFQCNYCITSHGRKVFFKSAENVINEVEYMVKKGIRVIRFIDDTFNVDKKRVKAICEGIIKKRIKVKWSFLSRVDTLDGDVLSLMKRAGCVRAYIGIESYSQRIIEYYDKGYDSRSINVKLKLVRKTGMEVAGFIMIGAPQENFSDLKVTLRGLLDSPLDFAIVTKLIPYPGTPLFVKEKDKIEFSIMPYLSSFRFETDEFNPIEAEKEIYNKFYFRPVQMARVARILCKTPVQSLKLAKSFVGFLLRKDKNKDHPDFL